MNKLIPLIFLTFLCCKLNTVNDNKQEGNIYIAKGNFGKIEISKSKLDSILSSLPYWRLNEFKTTDSEKSAAVQILRQELRQNNQEPDRFLIIEITGSKPKNITFHLNRIDTYVYLYILNQDSDMTPITGNATGVDGLYSVDLETEEISIAYYQ
ncbi:hypothetical protein [Carboxylicivirga taeanensis]|uniref:hypothetical protein n=1 Tax=Carboxylicivirga taeanensis TaxID=1416875 RepID=UPI003F6DCB90